MSEDTPEEGRTVLRTARRRLAGPDEMPASVEPPPRPWATFRGPDGHAFEVPEMVSLICFDLDGTLISSYMENEDKDYNVWSVLPNRPEILATLRAAGITVAVVTNQAGVGYGYNTAQDFWAKADAALSALGLPADTTVAVSFAAPKSRDPFWSDPRLVRRRKPSGLMIREVMTEECLSPDNPVDRQRVLLVGDRVEDAGAADDAGVYYMHPAEIFDRAGIEADEAKLAAELAELDRAFF